MSEIRTNVVEPGLTQEERDYWAFRAVKGIQDLRDNKGLYSGTCVIAGNGPSQKDIPLTWLNENTTFGLNYCHKREGFKPKFFVVGDVSVGEHEWAEAYDIHRLTPMFLPSPGMDSFGSERRDMYRYKRVKRHGKAVGSELDPTKGIAFTSVAHAATLIAVWLGYTQLLYVGLDGGDQTDHFYGKGYPNDYNRLGNDVIVQAWSDGFGLLRKMLPKHVELLNLSTQTTVASLPREDWRKY